MVDEEKQQQHEAMRPALNEAASSIRGTDESRRPLSETGEGGRGAERIEPGAAVAVS